MMKLHLALALLFSGAALAGTATSVPGDFVLRNPDGTYPAPYTEKSARFPTKEACDAAMAALNRTQQYKCDVSYKGTAVATCENERAPRIYLEAVTVDGQTAWEFPEHRWPLREGSTTEYVTVAWLYVHNSAWPAGYPNCWVRGWEDTSLWRVNPAAEPARPFMERIEPGMTADDTDLQNSIEPFNWVPTGPYCKNGDCSTA